MATPPVFSAGAVLTAAQMNAVGLWEIKTQTIGTGVASFEVTGAFSSDYDNYKIVINSMDASVNFQQLPLQPKRCMRYTPTRSSNPLQSHPT